MNTTRAIVAALAILGLAFPAAGQTSYPMLTRVEPTAIQRGQVTEVVISGVQNLEGASALLFEGTGLSGQILEGDVQAKGGRRGGRNGRSSSIRASIEVAADSGLGPRELRIVTPRGVSTVGLVVIAEEPVVAEADDKANDDPSQAQEIALPAVVAGSVGKTEDVDWYRFRAESGQTIVFSLWGNRLENKIHDLQTHLDPLISLQDEAGRELAVGDNFYFADPMLSYTFENAGTYRLQVRDATYAGNANWTYALTISPAPFATSVFPMAVKPGSRAELRAEGVNFETSQAITLDVPSNLAPGRIARPLPTAQGPTQPVPLVVTTLPLTLETEDAPSEVEKATRVTLSSAVCGRLGEPNDRDGFAFEAEKGTIYSFEVVSRRVGSQADPVVRIVDAQGKQVIEADDTFGKDPRIEWTASADGIFAFEVRDLHSRGGPGFGYVVLAEVARPDYGITCDPDKLNAGPGSRAPLFVKVERRNGFKGSVEVNLEGLPVGLSASPLTISEAMTQGEIVVSAATDATPSASLVTLKGRAEGPDGPLVRSVEPQQEIYLPGGGRGLYEVSTLAAAVTEPSDIILEASPSEVALKPGESVKIEVTVRRKDGFDKPVNLAVELAHLGRIYASALPPGVNFKAAGSKTLVGAKEAKGSIILEAKADAKPCEAVPIAVMGHVSINFVVKTAFCSAPIQVSVSPK